MTPLPAGAGTAAATVAPRTPLAELVTQVATSSEPLLVEDADGRVLGVVTREAVLTALAGRPAGRSDDAPQLLETIDA
ncbi:hypothetical protein [Blastococcus brunescens]|uniref:CBS domain-containing protein n=1 Tax=Blastococcus brunescens TaxID=1564165 RepID=A0ABZ1B6R4_9ACTN|nr:hypothetical protein [Blastococcus sp. BMG 8361]WRL66476.1 hypothetical protein U6N30_14280 [Blastococcus sp. BMG 8361]